MSRTKKGSKGPGFDYWSPRPGNGSGGNCPGVGVKTRTHRLERRRPIAGLENDPETNPAAFDAANERRKEGS